MRRFLESYFLNFVVFDRADENSVRKTKLITKETNEMLFFFSFCIRLLLRCFIFFLASLRFTLLCYTMENNLNVWQRLSTLRANVSIRTETECVESKYEISEDSSIYCTNVHTILCCSQMLSSSSFLMLVF